MLAGFLHKLLRRLSVRLAQDIFNVQMAKSPRRQRVFLSVCADLAQEIHVFGQMIVERHRLTVLNLIQGLLNEIQCDSIRAVDSLGVLWVRRELRVARLERF